MLNCDYGFDDLKKTNSYKRNKNGAYKHGVYNVLIKS